MHMKTAGLILFWLAALTAGAQTNPGWAVCRNPVRVFSARSTVNLTPLFQWWARQPLPTNAAAYTSANITTNISDDDRPLTAWHRITGTPVATTTAGTWVVDAVIYTSPSARTNARIILNHPPVVEEQNYYILKTELAEADQEIADTRHIYEANTNAEQQADERVEMYRHSLSKVAPTGVNVYSREAQQKHNAAAVALGQQEQLEAARQQILNQLKTIPARDETYYIDWFAVLLGHTKKGQPMYDLGLVSPNPP